MALISPFAVTDPYYVSWMFSDAQILEDSQTYYNAAIAFHVSIKDRRPEYNEKNYAMAQTFPLISLVFREEARKPPGTSQ